MSQRPKDPVATSLVPLKVGATLYEVGAEAYVDEPQVVRRASGMWAVFSRSGALSVSSGTSVWEWPGPTAIAQVRIAVGTAPTGDDLIVDVTKDGVSIFASMADQPTILAGDSTGQSSIIATRMGGPGELYRVDITQVGSTVAGSDLTLMLIPG